MATSIVFLQDLAIVLVVAALTSLLFQRLKFPLVFGLLAAGVIVGPNTPPVSLVQDEANLQTLADLGVVLILFGLGLDFNLRTIRRVGAAAAAVVLIEVVLMLWVGFEVGLLLGWSRLDAIFLGAMLSISSTAIIVSVLRELGRLDDESSRVVFAVLVMEDIAAVLMLVLLSGYAATGSLPLGEAAGVAGRMTLFLVGGLALGLVLIPRLLDIVVKRFRSEVTVLVVLGLGLGMAVVSEIAGFHMGLGAFLAGVLASEAKNKHIVEERFRPVHDLFGAVFFVSIGTLVDFSILAQYWRPIVLITIVILVGKLVSGALATFFAGYSPKTSIEVGASLAQIGEFSFVIAAVGLATQTMSPYLFPIIVACAALTSFMSPLMIRFGPRLAADVGAVLPASLRTYASVYSNWMRALRNAPRQRGGRTLAARRRTILSAVLVIVVLGAALIGQRDGQAFIADRLGSTAGAGLVYWGAFMIIMVPLAFELAREVGRWTEAAQAVNFPRAGPAVGVRAVVRYTLYVVVAIFVGLPVMAATAPFIQGWVVFLTWLLVVTAATVLLWSGVQKLHTRLHENVEALLRDERLSVPIPEVVEAAVARGLSGPLGTSNVRLEPNAWSVGKRIAELGLRSHTGATILLINRGDQQISAAPQESLFPGDDVVILGSREQIDASRDLLTRPVALGLSGRVIPGQLYVHETSPMAGRTLAESGLGGRFGVQIVAIQRGSSVIANPGPAEPIQIGDVLVVLGGERGVLEAQRFFASKVGGNGGPATSPAPVA